MTYQRDPERPIADDDIVRRENIANRDAEFARQNAEEAANTRFSPVATIIALAVLVGLGYFLYSTMSPRHPDAQRTTEYSIPRNTPTTAPTAPAAPVAPQTK